MKKYLFIATALAALASCTSDDFVGENSSPNPGNGTESAIVFSSGTNAITRAALTGAEAAEKLNNNFVFMGTKTVSGTESSVFDHYNANWMENTANTTESNSNDWEYVGYTPVAGLTSLPAGATQSIKYWDYAASQYDFAAYSLGKGDAPDDIDNSTFATATAFYFDNLGSDAATYTLSGTVDQLKACYISDLVTHYNNTSTDNTSISPDAATTFGKVVNFSFRSLATKIRLAFFETVPGYSVKEVKFYTSDANTDTDAEFAKDNNDTFIPAIFAETASLPTQAGTGTGIISVSFPTTGWTNAPENPTVADPVTDYNKAHVTFVANGSSTSSSTMTFDALNDFAGIERMEEPYNYLGRASNVATYAGGLVDGSGKYFTVLPNEVLDSEIDNLENLMICIQYTLVSTDGSNEEIVVDKATAVIPKELANWHPNYAYTYIFKISNMTNGTTGVGPDGEPVMGLTPITLNAVVVDSEDGVQETITTVSDPSITTYMKGKVVAENNEYIETDDDHPIYVVVNNGSDNVALTVNTDAKLYKARVDAGALQEITEQSVDNALRYGDLDNPDNPTTYTVTDAENKSLVLTDISDELTANTKIVAAESPTGDEITLNNASFVPGSGVIYVFQYKGNASGAYGEYEAVAPGTLVANKTYYKIEGGNYTEFTATGDEKITSDGETYYTQVMTYESALALTTGTTYYYYDPTNSSANADGYVAYVKTADDAPNHDGGYFRQVPTYKEVPYATLTAGTTYYTTSRGAGKFIATGSEVIDSEEKYWTEETAEVDGEYMYKIIKVAE